MAKAATIFRRKDIPNATKNAVKANLITIMEVSKCVLLTLHCYGRVTFDLHVSLILFVQTSWCQRPGPNDGARAKFCIGDECITITIAVSIPGILQLLQCICIHHRY